MKNVVLALGLALFAACGPLHETRGLPDLSAFGFGGQSLDSAGLQRELANNTAARNASNVLLYGVVSDDRAGILLPDAEGGAVRAWRATSGVSVVTQQGIAVATRGFGDDLMGAEVSNVVAALTRGAGQARRIYEHLDGQDQIITSVYDCSYETLRRERVEVLGRAYLVNVIAEGCRNEARSFANVYWRANSGAIVQSRQWISRGTGYMDLQLR